MRAKKIAAAAAVFAAVLNMNGCVYGPPPQDIENDISAADKAVYETEEISPSDGAEENS